MPFNIDVFIVIAFLVINLTLGVYVGRGIRTIKEYAIGSRDFSTGTIAATIIATWISGSFFTVCISQTYTEGVWFLPAALGDILSLLIIGYLFGPRMKEFFGSLSVAETMGNLFGKHVRIITAICSIAQAVAMTALQIKVFSSAFSYFLGFSSLYATCISSLVVILYSAWGGIRAVTFTDVIQFFTFGMFIPLFLLFVWETFVDIETVHASVQTNQLLDYKQLLNWNDPKFLPNLVMLFWFLIPSLNSPLFQRILMTRNTKQIRMSFSVAAIGYSFVIFSTCAIGMLILSINPNLDSNNIVMYIVDNYSFTGLKGITLIGIMAMVMSTADSWINTGAVIFAHDLCHPLGIKFKNELFLSRCFSLFVGSGSLLLVLSNESLFKLFSLQANFYMPIVTVPLTLAILGFRSSGRSVILGMLAGIICVITWKIYIQPETGIDSVIPALIANLIVLMGSHYLLRQSGGWIGIKDSSDLEKVRQERKKIRINLSKFWKNLFVLDWNKYLPKNDITYLYFAFVVLVTTFVTPLSIERISYHQHFVLINVLVGINLLISTIFVTHKLWWNEIFETKYIGIIWLTSVFCSLAFISTILALISNFSPVSMIVLILDLTIIGYLMRWQTALVMIISGVYLALFGYQKYIGSMPNPDIELGNIKWNIVYILLAVGGLLVIFLKPRQEHEELVEEQNSYLENMMEFKDVELQKAIDLKYEFLRNLEHESHTPITGITSLGQVLWESYDLLSEKQRRQGLEDIAKNSEKLSTLVNNMIDLSKLSSLTYKLNVQKINLTKLVSERIETCQKLYLKDKDLEFVLDIDNEIIVRCDSYYITRVLDNLITNAIGYSESGTIFVKLSKESNGVKFSIRDEGVGIPESELYDIFGAFVVSSKTRTPSGGRGVGLALCKKSIEAHGGKIWAESDGKKGATFCFVIPVK